jgi:hypothetical protein
MPNRSRKTPKQKDTQQLARHVLDAIAPDAEPPKLKKKLVKKKNPAAVALGRKGGIKGGRARADRLTPEERTASARKAAQARWASRPKATDSH